MAASPTTKFVEFTAQLKAEAELLEYNDADKKKYIENALREHRAKEKEYAQELALKEKEH
jgi:hypothetical protein